jgi:hypothetical protein
MEWISPLERISHAMPRIHWKLKDYCKKDDLGPIWNGLLFFPNSHEFNIKNRYQELNWFYLIEIYLRHFPFWQGLWLESYIPDHFHIKSEIRTKCWRRAQCGCWIWVAKITYLGVFTCLWTHKLNMDWISMIYRVCVFFFYGWQVLCLRWEDFFFVISC